jgi:hypothetical protein
MKDSAFKVVALLILVGGGYFLYTRVQKNKNLGDVDTIILSGNASNKTVLLTFQPEFLSAWANAVKDNKSTFVFNNKTYNTKGGSTVKK